MDKEENQVDNLEKDEETGIEETHSNETEIVDLEQDESGSLEVEKIKSETESVEFDWDEANNKVGRFKANYSSEDYENLMSMYEDSIASINKGDIVEGTVTALTAKEAIIDVGYKSEGLIPFSEFRDIEEDIKVGDKYDVYVETREDINGQLALSRTKAKTYKAWEFINQAFENDAIIEGVVKSRTKGGLIVNIDGIEAFLPGSQIDVKPIRDFDLFLGKKMEFKVVKINHEFKNVIVSHKILIEKELEKQREGIIASLEKGQILEGVVKNITDFGAFIDLGGVDGLLYITDISWTRIDHPSDVLTLDQKINVVVLDFNDEKKRISLGLKQFTPHPWDTLDENIKENSKVKGKIVTIASYGFFIEIVPGVEGLIHASEISWSGTPINPNEVYNIGDEVEAMILTIDREERKMSLGIKQLTPDPWASIDEQFSVGTKHSAKVSYITNYGVFVELKNGLSGLIHISDLSWTKKINHPNEVTSIGETIELIVLEIDRENRKLRLGHKQIDSNPWDTLEETFGIGSVHEGTVTKITSKGAIVALPYGIEGFAPARFLNKEDNTKIQVDEALTFKVKEFEKDNKKIILTHSDTWKKEVEEKPKKTTSKSKQQKAISNIQQSIEKTTLGEQAEESLGKLKEQMQSAENKKAETKSKTKKSKKEDSDE